MEEKKPEILDSIAKLWIMDAHDQTGAHSTDMQWLIDHVADHNQLMLDCVENVSDDLRDVIRELMESEMEDDDALWMLICSQLFCRVDATLKAGP